MATKYTIPIHSNKSVRRAGETLRSADPWHPDLTSARSGERDPLNIRRHPESNGYFSPLWA